MVAPEAGVRPEAAGAREGADAARPTVTVLQLLVMLGLVAFSVLFFIKTQDAMILIFGVMAVTMVGLGWSRISRVRIVRDGSSDAAASAPLVLGPGGMARLAAQLAVGAFAVLRFIQTQDAMILVFGVIAVALIEIAFGRR